ncbi:sulfatase [Bacteroides sp. 519]|uniref:sulfatase family protein n=1 Tax=Bacteroides sp. 519 TaxID=2302937 RepID=UPI0013D71463|nr:sulfatase-like hydrolase/transferase [Bacteroides sp. 519]NDV58305.1 sulfatase [Bacteroides sp. 519]
MNYRKILYSGIAIQGLGLSLFAQTDKPNIVVIMTDQQRADYCGREGFPLEITPYVDGLARENVWFDKAYTVMPASTPARCSMFTGRFPNATHVRTNHNVRDINYEKDLVTVLKENNYKTALVGKNHSYLKATDLDFWSEYGHWGKNKPTTEGDRIAKNFFKNDAVGQYLDPSPIPLKDQQPTRIVDETIQWIDSQKGNPFFVWVSFPEPHNPFQVCEPYYSMFSPEKLPALKTSRQDAVMKGEKYRILAALEDASCPNLEQDLPRLRGNYMGMIRLIDDQIKRLIEDLKEKGLYENTIFVILSDHGDYCGEYGLIRKGAGLSESLARIPMVWAGYGIKNQSKPLDAHVSLADLFPTFCTAIDNSIPMGVQGRSLWPMLTGKEYPKEEFSSIVVQQGFGGEDFPLTDDLTFEQEGSFTPNKIAHFDELNTWTQSGMLRMIRMGDWKLVMNSYGNGELYNLKKDPYEVDNLFGKAKYASRQNELLTKLMAWELRLQDPLPVPRHRYHFKRNFYNYHFQDK